jgi:hypothetical protein
MAEYDSVAITGLSCRLPGEGDTLDNFWQSICAGKCKYSTFIRLILSVADAHLDYSGMERHTPRALQHGRLLVAKQEAQYKRRPRGALYAR